MNYYAELNEQNQIVGFYIEDMHGVEFCQSLAKFILVNEDLHQHLLSQGLSELTTQPERRVYTKNDMPLFVEVQTVPQDRIVFTEQRISALEQLIMGVL